MLVKASNWIVETFAEGSRPDIKTVKRWINSGEIEGKHIGKQLYIVVEKNEGINDPQGLYQPKNNFQNI